MSEKPAVEDKDMVVSEPTETDNASQEPQMVPGAGTEHRAPHEHRPALSVWPLPLAVGVAMALVGLAINPGLIGGGAAIAAMSLIGWLREARAEDRVEALHTRLVQVVVFQVLADDVTALEQPGGILARLHEHQQELRRRDGFVDMLIIRTPPRPGPTLFIVETGWAERDQLSAYAWGKNNVETLVRAAGEPVLTDTVEVYDMEVPAGPGAAVTE